MHVVQRGIIFIDIAMAQLASLGVCLAVLLHMDLESPAAFAISLGFTLIGAAIFSLTGKRASKVPQEAIIGISYVVAAAAAVLLLSRGAEGDEEIKNMLVGNILLVTPAEVWKAFALFGRVESSTPSSGSQCCALPWSANAPSPRECASAGGISSSMLRLASWSPALYVLPAYCWSLPTSSFPPYAASTSRTA
jgi:hypothetical protein